MLDRIRWTEVAEKPARQLSSKIHLTIDLSPDKPGGERTPLEQALRTIFASGWRRKDAKWFALQAINAVSKAIIEDGHASFPLEAAMLGGPFRRPKPATLPAPEPERQYLPVFDANWLSNERHGALSRSQAKAIDLAMDGRLPEARQALVDGGWHDVEGQLRAVQESVQDV